MALILRFVNWPKCSSGLWASGVILYGIPPNRTGHRANYWTAHVYSPSDGNQPLIWKLEFARSTKISCESGLNDADLQVIQSAYFPDTASDEKSIASK